MAPTTPNTRRRWLLLAVALAAGAVLSGCTVVGVVSGGVLGALVGGPEGAAAGAELGLYMGASADAAILESLSYPSREHDAERRYTEWYGGDYDELDSGETGTAYAPTERDGAR